MTRSASAGAPLGIAAIVAFACALSCAGPEIADVEANEWLPGGDTTNTLLFGSNAFIHPADNITIEHESMFFTGNSFFNQSWVTAPSSTESRDGLGPLYNARSCAACHFKDGRGRPPLTPDEPFLGLLLRLGVPGADGEPPVPEPRYGGQLQPFSIAGVPAEGTPRVFYSEQPAAYDDGEPYTLLAPTYEIGDLAYGPLADDVLISPRVAPAVIGLGLLAAIPDDRLLALADPDDGDGDGVSGRVNRVPVIGGGTAIGRFGWKAEQPSVAQQSAGAFLGDIGITTSLLPSQDCTAVQTECEAALTGGAPEIDDDLLARVAVYSSLLAVPARHGYDDELTLRGKLLFGDIGCAGCHVPRHETDPAAALIEVADQQIWPYTDLLLHDMGDALADGRPVFEASGREWRTPPLWGVGRFPDVNGHQRLLHDGRARGVAEAIMWHGGEADTARDAFRALDAADRDALIQFVESL
jgi:CxxC motif-containing protein (DUF1111 family)